MSYEPTVWVDGDHVTSAKLNKLEQGVNSMSYTPTVWNAGDVVTAEKLNKLEQGVAEGGGGGGGATIPTVTLDFDNHTYTSDVEFDEWIGIIQNSSFVDGDGFKLYPCYEVGRHQFDPASVSEDGAGTYIIVDGSFMLREDGTFEEL